MGIDFGELTGFIVIASSAAVLGLSYVAAYLMGKNAARKEMDRRDGREMLGSARQPDRLERIESAVDTIALEVERIAEGQRFMAKVLVERGNGALGSAVPPIAPPRGPGSVTPH